MTAKGSHDLSGSKLNVHGSITQHTDWFILFCFVSLSSLTATMAVGEVTQCLAHACFTK